MAHTISVLVENKAGVLTRVTNIFSRRGYNIDSVASGTTHDPTVSRLTIITSIEEEKVKQVLKLLYKIPDVISAKHLTPSTYISRQLIFVKVSATAATRAEIGQIVDVFRGHIVDISPITLTIEISGDDTKLEAFQRMLEPYGILELVRTGLIAVERGEQQMQVASIEEN
ncbi:MAG: acetolactate synthase small subunit [Fastidiosipilaceae bacterium]|jgi:acetolactate synthase-1/3 small subunit|nr:acetolactate synthase small subunit [Clostridiaceae bacterium]